MVPLRHPLPSHLGPRSVSLSLLPEIIPGCAAACRLWDTPSQPDGLPPPAERPQQEILRSGDTASPSDNPGDYSNSLGTIVTEPGRGPCEPWSPLRCQDPEPHETPPSTPRPVFTLLEEPGKPSEPSSRPLLVPQLPGSPNFDLSLEFPACLLSGI
ncbi:unnamed protein product [Lepidochelys kempii]